MNKRNPFKNESEKTIWNFIALFSFSVFFLTRENDKCPRNQFLAMFLVFFSGEKYFSRPLLPKFSRAFRSFLGQIFRFFLGLHFIFLGLKYQNLKVFLCFWRGKFRFFFSGKEFFSRVEFSVFFPGTIFSSRAVFNIFSRAISNLLGRKIENFLGRDFFFLG